MASSRDDEECRSIPLPRGFSEERLKGLDLPGRDGGKNGPSAPTPGWPAPSGVKPEERVSDGPELEANGRRSLLNAHVPDLDSDFLATIPPAGKRRPVGGGAGAGSPGRSGGPGPGPPKSPPLSGSTPAGPRNVARPPAKPQGKTPEQRKDAWDDVLATNAPPSKSSVAHAATGPVVPPVAARSDKPPLDDSGSELWPEPKRPKSPSPEPSTEDAEPEYDHNGPTEDWQAPVIKFFNPNPKVRDWNDLGVVHQQEQIIGRSTFGNWNVNPEGLAEKHLKITYEDGNIYLEPLPTLNGTYRKVRPKERVELESGTRFRIGRHVLEYRRADPPAEIVPERSAEGEVFQAAILRPFGFVDLIGPDGRPQLSFPMTRADEPGTRIGRGGPDCDIALTGDDLTSAKHARLLFIGGKCLLEDLNSRNGTFVTLKERIPVRRGLSNRADSLEVILIGQYLIKLVEHKPGSSVFEAINTRAHY